MAIGEPADPKPSALVGGPPRWARALIYGVTWLPAIVLMVRVIPRFVPIFQKLDELGELPQPTKWLTAWVHVDTDCYHVPVVFLALALLAIDEWAVGLLRRKPNGNLRSWLWVTVVGLAGIVAEFVIVVGLLAPVFTLPAGVR